MSENFQQVVDQAEELIRRNGGSREEFRACLEQAAQAYPEGQSKFREKMVEDNDLPYSSYDRWLRGSTSPHPVVRKHALQIIVELFQPHPS